jgi:hypothetical protein
LRIKFVVAAAEPETAAGADDSSARDPLAEEQALHGDLLLVDTPEGYENLWRKVMMTRPGLCNALQHEQQQPGCCLDDRQRWMDTLPQPVSTDDVSFNTRRCWWR